MNKRFVKLYESIRTRYTNGGFLANDVVKFADGALRDPFFKEVQDDYKKEVERYITSGDTLCIKNIKSAMPAVMGAGNTDNNGYSFNAEVCREIAPGRFSNDAITVPVHLLVRVDSYPNLPEVPAKHRYEDKSHIDAKPVKDEGEEVPFFSPGRTRTADLGNGKDSKSETNLSGKNVKIPSMPAKGAKDPASYTAAYLP
jgi:hypothetical protein